MILICTSYTETENGLVLRNNWTEATQENELGAIEEKWGLSKEFSLSFPKNEWYSRIYEGRMELPNVVIHVRKLRTV